MGLNRRTHIPTDWFRGKKPASTGVRSVPSSITYRALLAMSTRNEAETPSTTLLNRGPESVRTSLRLALPPSRGQAGELTVSRRTTDCPHTDLLIASEEDELATLDSGERRATWSALVEHLTGLNRSRLDVHEHQNLQQRHPGLTSRSTSTGRQLTYDGAESVFGTSITFVERLSEKSVSLDWCNATVGRYCEQTWSRCSARRKGICGLTGAMVARGDVVYRPSARTAVTPANVGEVILESSLCRIERS